MTSYTATYSPDDDKLRLYGQQPARCRARGRALHELEAMKSILDVCRPE